MTKKGKNKTKIRSICDMKDSTRKFICQIKEIAIFFPKAPAFFSRKTQFPPMFYANDVISKPSGTKLPASLICWQREKARYNQNETGETSAA